MSYTVKNLPYLSFFDPFWEEVHAVDEVYAVDEVPAVQEVHEFDLHEVPAV